MADDVEAVCWRVLVSYGMEFEGGAKYGQREVRGLALRTDVHMDNVVFVLESTLAESVVVVVVVVESLADEVLGVDVS